MGERSAAATELAAAASPPGARGRACQKARPRAKRKANDRGAASYRVAPGLLVRPLPFGPSGPLGEPGKGSLR
jgi:hypothetical protein